ncbi:MAG: lysophospholipid acyltransferase family protein [Neisseria sp.]|nr:lysophospholipid acyltransferase family protein [Neisseria sp.]
MSFLLQCIFRVFGLLPLPVLHAIAYVAGTAAYFLAPKLRRRIAEHLRQAGIIADSRTVRQVARESIKGGLELAIAWTRSPDDMVGLFREIHGWEHVEAAMAAKQGLLLITPHLGSYDLAGRMISEKLPFPLTAMYRPPKKPYLEPVMNAGRQRGKGRTAPANAQGVRQVVRALRQREAVIVLPDQVPQAGEGVVVTFFDRPAYTMTLAARLGSMDNVTPLFFVGERLPYGRGFVLHIVPFAGSLIKQAAADAQTINHNVEALIRRFPTQYLFSYNRYKMPAEAAATLESAPPANVG